MTPAERSDFPWIIAVGAAVLITLVLYRIGVFEMAAGLLCWAWPGCEF